MKSTYLNQDVTILLKDISGMVEPLDTIAREKLIQTGTHYSEMLPLEYKPSKKYMEAYYFALSTFAKPTADAVCVTAEKIYQKLGNHIVLVSLARAGIPIGILLKHYLEEKYQLHVSHYSISIIRGKGIDKNAIDYILSHHKSEHIQFVDGWIGKGAIQSELKSALKEYKSLSSDLAVLSDPANITNICGTHDDILIPSSCLNSTISGLISRTFLRDDIIDKNDFHGAAFYSDLLNEDLSYDFIQEIERYFNYSIDFSNKCDLKNQGYLEALEIMNYYKINDINFIKPGIGEATRVLLRRYPYKLLLAPNYKKIPTLHHLVQLAKEKDIPIEEYPFKYYKACGIIKKMSDI